MTVETLQELAAGEGLRLPASAAPLLLEFARMVEDQAVPLGLTSLQGIDLWREFLLDPLAATPLLEEGGSLVDIGSGGGTPGISLALLRPELAVTLIESHGRKAGFLRRAGEALRLSNLRVEHGRAEDLGRDPAFREQFAWGTAKALAALPVALELVLPFLRVNGRFLAFKGPGLEQEIRASARALELLGGQVLDVHRYRLQDRDYRIAVVEKKAPTPEHFPRRAGVPQRKPLVY